MHFVILYTVMNSSFRFLAFGLGIIRVRLVLGLELEVLVSRAEEHLTMISNVSKDSKTYEGIRLT